MYNIDQAVIGSFQRFSGGRPLRHRTRRGRHQSLRLGAHGNQLTMKNILLPINILDSESEIQPGPAPSPALALVLEPEVVGMENQELLPAESATNEHDSPHLLQFLKHHQLACLADEQAFYHTVVAAIAIVLIKVESRHGQYSQVVQEAFDGIPERTLRRYRKAGERYLSCAHGTAITAQLIRQKKLALKQELCDDKGVMHYLQTNGINSHNQLVALTNTLFPQDHKLARNTLPPSTKALQALELALAKMDQTSRDDFWKGMVCIGQKYPPLGDTTAREPFGSEAVANDNMHSASTV